jgi:hypothetical protein
MAAGESDAGANDPAITNEKSERLLVFTFVNQPVSPKANIINSARTPFRAG